MALLLGLTLSCSDDGVSSALDGATPDNLLPTQDSSLDLAHDSGRSAKCLDQDTQLQAALDAARKSPSAMLVVRNTACGTTVYVSGDSSAGSATSLWRIGSITKTYVSATILSLVRDGTLSLGDALSKWIPNVPKTDGVTLKMLLNHTSGIFSYTDDPKYMQDPMKEWKPSELVDLGAAHEPYFAPGAGWHYSNTNYILLGMIAEKAGAAKASELIRKRTLEPAVLEHTFLEGEEALEGRLATGFDKIKNDVTYKYSMSFAWTAGAMTASGADLCNWIYTLFATTQVLGTSERQAMLEGVDTGAGDKSKYGLGVFMLDPSVTAGAGPAMGHGGDIFGFHSQAFWFPEKQTAICAVVNQDGTSPNDLTLAALLTLFT